jgi:hypothetical protein
MNQIRKDFLREKFLGSKVKWSRTTICNAGKGVHSL